MLFYCNVGESGLELKARYGSFNVPYRKCQFLSVNEFYTSQGSISDQGVEGEANETWMVLNLAFRLVLVKC